MPHILQRVLLVWFVAGVMAAVCCQGGPPIVVIPEITTIVSTRPNTSAEYPSQTNAIPFQESFEKYTNNAPISGSRGWWGSVNDASSATNAALPSSITEFPIQTNHTRYASLNTVAEGDWLINVITGAQQHVWLDMLVSFVSGDLPLTNATSQFMLFVFDPEYNPKTNLYVYARSPNATTNGFISSSIPINCCSWPWSPGVFYRLSIHLAYLPPPTGGCFAVYLNDKAVNWPGGELLPGTPSTSGQGPWLRCIPGTGNSFPGVAFCGLGYIDDLVVTDQFPLPTSNLTARIASNPLALTWQSDFGRAYQVESCTNLVTHNWQPFGSTATGTGLTNLLSIAASNSAARFFKICSPNP